MKVELTTIREFPERRFTCREIIVTNKAGERMIFQVYGDTVEDLAVAHEFGAEGVTIKEQL